MARSSSEYGFNAPHEGQDVRSTFSVPTFEALRKANQTLTDLFAAAPLGQLNVVIDGEADIASSFGVTDAYFRVLGLNAALGRTLTADDHKPGATAAAVISHAFWRKRFASNPNVVNRVVTINGQPVTIVGVLPASFGGIQRLGAAAPEVTLPLSMDSALNVGQTRSTEPTWWWVHVFGRLKPGATFEQVTGNLAGVFQQAARDGMATYESGLSAERRALETNRRRSDNVPSLFATSGARGIYDFDPSSARAASILSAVVGLVMLIVCANVANLLLSRATARRKEISVRLSVGATRARLVRQLLTESLVLSGIGGALGLVLGYFSRTLLPFGREVPMDWRVFGFVAGLSAIAGIAFGLVPAFRATRLDLASAMKESSRSVSGTRSRLGKVLLVAQVAISLVLLVGAGLFLRTLSNLRAVDIGFNPNNLLMFSVNPVANRYEPERTRQIFRDLQDQLAATPGVRSVALTRVALLSGSTSITSTWLAGKTESTNVHLMSVSPGFFQTMEIPLRLGRDFTASDVEGAPKVAVVNETAARTLFPDGAPLGRRFGFERENSTEVEIVGIIGDTKYSNLRAEAPPTVYQPHMQGPPRGMNVVLRTAGDPAGLVEPVRQAVRRVDNALPLTNIATQTEQIERRFEQERLFANAYVLFGALALTLASIGLFGLMSYNVSRRTNEIGIRMALGANRHTVARMVLGESLLVVAIGITLGLAGALAAGRFVETILFGLQPNDALTMAFAALLIATVTIAAAYVPARRASRVDPMVALRQD
jgi:predicted permease